MGESKTHQWILEFGGSLKRNRIDTSPHRLLLNTKSKNSNFAVQNPKEHHHNEMIKALITNNGAK